MTGAEGNGSSRGGVDLVGLLHEVEEQGWDSIAGHAAVGHLRRVCRGEASRWTHSAGWFSDEGLADVWEAANRLLVKGQLDVAPAVVRRVAQRSYAGEAAAAQTGVGTPKTRGLVAIARAQRSNSLTTTEALESLPAVDTALEPAVPVWMRVLAVMLMRDGWSYLVPALDAVVASAAVVALNGRRRQSPLAGHDTGVPAAAWSGLALLVAGSGPGCAADNRQVGAPDLFARVGAAGLRLDTETRRLVRGIVAGKSLRTSRVNRIAA